MSLRTNQIALILFGSFVIGYVCSAYKGSEIPTTSALQTATPRPGLLATFTATHQPSATPIPASESPSPSETETPAPTETSLPSPTPAFISWDQAGHHIGEEWMVCGPVMDTHYATSSNGLPTFLNIGETFPHPDRFTIVIWGDDRDKFPGKPEDIYIDLEICATGMIEEYNDMPEMIVTEPDQITIP